MWVCFNDCYLSIVAKECAPDELLVRARRDGDIERVFPGAVVTVSLATDYRCRARVKRADVAAAVAARIAGIDYGNFKDSTRDNPLHNAYMGVWSALGRLQPGGPYRAGLRRASHQRSLLDDGAPRGGLGTAVVTQK